MTDPTTGVLSRLRPEVPPLSVRPFGGNTDVQDGEVPNEVGRSGVITNGSSIRLTTSLPPICTPGVERDCSDDRGRVGADASVVIAKLPRMTDFVMEESGRAVWEKATSSPVIPGLARWRKRGVALSLIWGPVIVRFGSQVSSDAAGMPDHEWSSLMGHVPSRPKLYEH